MSMKAGSSKQQTVNSSKSYPQITQITEKVDGKTEGSRQKAEGRMQNAETTSADFADFADYAER
jgi:hypothetical protein